MWADLRREVQDEFVGLQQPDTSTLTRWKGFPADRHPDAERWIAASDEERQEMRGAFDMLLREKIRSIARSWSDGRRDRASWASYMRSYRKRPDAAEKDRKRSAAWRKANRERAAENLRKWRARRKS